MSIQHESKREESSLRELMVARSRVEVADLQYKRRLKKLRRGQDKQVSQSKVARRLHISQPALSKALKASEGVEDVPEGFSGASPREICQLYAIGELSREQLIDELSRWQYPAVIKFADDWDNLSFSPPGSWDEVERAADDGLIDDDLLDDVIDALPEGD